jgi:hypothetical protein
MKPLCVVGLKRFFQDGREEFIFTYYHGRQPLEVYLEYDILMEAQYIYLYALRQERGVWFFSETSQVCTESGTSPHREHYVIAGYSRESAVQFMIDKILTKPKSHIVANVDVLALETLLQERFLRKCEN